MRALTLLILGLAILVSAVQGLDALNWIPAANHFSHTVSVLTEGWFPVINLRNNAFLYWRIDSALLPIFSLLPIIDLAAGLTCAALLIFFMGLSLLFLRLTKHRTPARAVLSALGICLSLLCIFGWDNIIFQFLAWIPLLTLCAMACLHGRQAFGIFFILTLFVAYRITQSANELAPLATIIGLTAAALFFRALLAENEILLQRSGGDGLPADQRLSPLFARILTILLIACLTITALPFIDAPSPNGQNYPWMAHVVSEDWIAGNASPLLGPGPAIPFIDRDALKGYFGPLSIGLLLLLLIFRVRELLPQARLARFTLNSSIVLAVLTVLDTNLPESLAYICPGAALARIIPGSCLFPLAEIWFALAFSLFALTLCLEYRFKFLTCFFVLAILLPKMLLQGALPRLRHQFASNLSTDDEKYLISPSFPVIHAHNLLAMRDRERIRRTQFLPSNTVPMTAVASHTKPGNETHFMFDQNGSTRWSAGRAYQIGDEWLYLRFSTPQTLSAIELATSFFKTDHPRALRISVVEGCPEQFTRREDIEVLRQELITYKPWHGSFEYTSEGFPFYSAPKRVRAFLPTVTATQCLLVEQIGRDKGVDWSVAEIRLGIESTEPVVNENLDQ